MQQVILGLRLSKKKTLDKEMDGFMGKHSLGWLVSNVVILHIANLTGEISAAKRSPGT